jgi:hypothetical protein
VGVAVAVDVATVLVVISLLVPLARRSRAARRALAPASTRIGLGVLSSVVWIGGALVITFVMAAMTTSHDTQLAGGAYIWFLICGLAVNLVVWLRGRKPGGSA